MCIPSYNGGSYIEDQVKSILVQLSDFDEIIVSDDSSIDATIDILRSIDDNRIVILEGNCFKSPIYNLENAINHSTGEIIILADQDDVWLPGRVTKIVDALCKSELVFTNAYIVDKFLNKNGNTIFDVLGPNKSLFGNIIKNSFIGCCIAFNSTLKLKILPFPHNLPMHDQWIGLIAKLYHSISFIYEPTLLYRRHGNNTSNTGEKSTNSFLTKLSFRISIITSLISRGFKISFSKKAF